MKYATYALHLTFQRYVALTVWALIFTVCLMLSLYSYFLNGAVQAAVHRSSFEEEAALLTSEVSELEFAYVTLRNEVTLETARSFGFMSSEDITYISKDDPTYGLSLDKGR